MDFLKDYICRLRKTIDMLDLDGIQALSDMLITCSEKENTIFLCGNGGSAACASHIANDLAKLTIAPGKKRFRVISLTDSIPLLTAWANDNGYEDCFVEPLKNLYREGDILIAISGSGNSKNVLKAVEYVNTNKGVTIGLTGGMGGRLESMARHVIRTGSDNMQIIEDIHVLVGHMVCSYIAKTLQR